MPSRARLVLASLAVLVLGCGGGGGDGEPLPDAQPAADALVLAAGEIPTEGGVMRGERTGEAWSWKGVPYAAPPIGALRFRPPAPVAHRDGISDAIAFAPACPQNDADGVLFGSEDCLYLNIWAPADAVAQSALPVLVFVHGGGMQQGSASQTLDDGSVLYDGQRFVERSGAILVTFDYRLGPLGFLAHPALSAEGPEKSGNYGTLDQIAALRWVRDNIGGFGGDPSRVMVFGESAGAVSTCRLIASPLAAGLFSAAAIESGACVAKSLADAETFGSGVALEVGCSDAACLRAVPVEALLATVPPLDAGQLRQSYDGVVDGHALLAPPLDVIAAGQHNHVPVIVGSNTEEQGRAVPLTLSEEQYAAAVATYAQSLGAPNLAPVLLGEYPTADYPSPRAALVAMMTDIKFACPTRKSVRALSDAQDEPVYRYVFSKVPDAAGPGARTLGAVHGAELLFLFDALGDAAGPNDRAVINAMIDTWGELAASGDPNRSDGLALVWPAYDDVGEAHLFLDDTLAIQNGYREAQCDFLESLTR